MFRSHCARCHGVKGEGGIGPSLAAGIFYHGDSDSDLAQNISNGIQGTAMPGTFFDHGQVSQIVAYVRSLSRSLMPACLRAIRSEAKRSSTRKVAGRVISCAEKAGIVVPICRR
jgi:mono/diheme cytochrome c family protein